MFVILLLLLNRDADHYLLHVGIVYQFSIPGNNIGISFIGILFLRYYVLRNYLKNLFTLIILMTHYF